MDSFDFLMLHLLSYFFIFFPRIFIDKKAFLFFSLLPKQEKNPFQFLSPFRLKRKSRENRRKFLFFLYPP